MRRWTRGEPWPARRDPVVLACALGLAAVLVHLPCVSNDFVFDDVPAVLENPAVTGEAGWEAVASRNFWGGRERYEHVTTWRPLTTATFRVEHALAGPAPASFHAVNVLLHGVVVALLFGVLHGFFSRLSTALVGTALFAVLPAHVEAIAGVVNRAELLAACFFLLATLAMLRATRPAGEPGQSGLWWLLAACAFGAALLCKEHTVVWPAAAALVFFVRWLRARSEPRRWPAPRPPPAWAVVAVAALVAGWLAARWCVLPSVLGGDIPRLDNPLVGEPLGTRLFTAAKVLFRYLGILLAPLHLSADYSAHALPLAEGPFDPDALAGLLVSLLSMAALWHTARRWRTSRDALDVAFCLGLFAILYVLVSNTFLLGTVLMAERLLYLPSIALCALVGVFGGAVWRGSSGLVRGGVVCALLVVLGGYAIRSVVRAGDWRDDVTLFRSSLDACPDSAKARYNLGRELLLRGALDEGEEHLREAARLAPDEANAWQILGTIRFRRADYEGALQHFGRAFELEPGPATASDLCRATVASSQPAEGEVRCALAARLDQENAMVHFYHGMALRANGKPSAALGAFRRAARIEPDNPVVARELLRTMEGRDR